MYSSSVLAQEFKKVLSMQAIREKFWPGVPLNKITCRKQHNNDEDSNIVFVYQDENVCQELVFKIDTNKTNKDGLSEEHDGLGLLKPVCGHIQEVCQVDNWDEIVNNAKTISKLNVIDRAFDKCCDEVENTNKRNKNKWFYYNWHPYSRNSKIMPLYTDDRKTNETNETSETNEINENNESLTEGSLSEESIEYCSKDGKLLMTLECDCHIDEVNNEETYNQFLKMWKDKTYFPNKDFSDVVLVSLS
jgi:hypothetical protein